MKTNSMCAQGTTRGTPMVKVAQVIGGAILVVALAILIGQTTAQPAWAATGTTTDNPIAASSTPTSYTITTDGGNSTANVEVKVTNTPTIVYSVKIDWPNLAFTYTFDNTDTWNPATHKYSSSSTTSGSTAGAGWSSTEETIKVTNDSNTGITYSAEFSKATQGSQTPQVNITDSDVELTLSNYTETIPTAVNTNPGDPTLTKEIKLSVSGIPNSTVDPVLTEPITITITKATN
jgi:hypothetical protein